MLAGGSCANVLTILSYMGWMSYPIAFLGDDEYTSIVVDDLHNFDVNTDFIRKGTARIPIIVERILSTRGGSKHVFEFTCPNCGSPLPRNHPVPVGNFPTIVRQLPISQVYYFDRVSRFSLALARHARALGSIVMFEPARYSQEPLFNECLKVAHIVKYSIEQLQIETSRYAIPLEVQTMGAEGLLYRLGSDQSGRWIKLDSYQISPLVDTAGAGDWCSAGILLELGPLGSKRFNNSRQKVEHALRFGQGLAAINCSYIGARGSMYNLSRLELKEKASHLLNGESSDQNKSNYRAVEKNQFGALCPFCNDKNRPVSSRKMSRPQPMLPG